MRFLSHGSSSPESRGQSLVEFALVLPILMIMLLGVIDMARVYTALNSVESAAREAAGYGAFNSSRWIGDPSDPTSNHAKTIAEMTRRACEASGDLLGYEGTSTNCTNPSVAIELVEEDLSAATGCDDPERTPGPCWVKVVTTYTFDVLVPAGIDLFDVRLGLPDELTFTRTSIFAIANFGLDEA